MWEKGDELVCVKDWVSHNGTIVLKENIVTVDIIRADADGPYSTYINIEGHTGNKGPIDKACFIRHNPIDPPKPQGNTMTKLKNPFKFKKHAPEFEELADIVAKNYPDLNAPNQLVVVFGLLSNWVKYTTLIADAAKRPAQEAHLMFQTDVLLAASRDLGYNSEFYNLLESTENLEADMPERVALSCLNTLVQWFRDVPVTITDRLWLTPTAAFTFSARNVWVDQGATFNDLRSYTKIDTSKVNYVNSKKEIKTIILQSMIMHTEIPKFMKGESYEV